MKRIRLYLKTILLIALFVPGMKAQCQDSPNIVLILADDLGWGDVSYNQPTNTFKTPNIDRLAEEGVHFTNAHTPHSVCTPTRYSLLTGRYCWRTTCREGVLPGYGKPLITQNRMTLASLLKQKGYKTGVFGKWHLGLQWTPAAKDDPGDFHFGSQLHAAGQAKADISKRVNHMVPVKGGPTDLGFDTFFGTPGNFGSISVFMRNDRVIGSPVSKKNGMIQDTTLNGNKADDIYVDEAIKFMGSAQKSDEPFFIYLALNAAHAAVGLPKEFQGKTGLTWRTDKCLWVNRSVGRIYDALEQANLSENTIVIFTSDNGPYATKGYELEKGHDASGPYRGFKTDAWAGGTRVPFIVRWPGRIPAGTSNDALLCLTDMLSTFADLTGQELPMWAGEDSFNQLPTLLSGKNLGAREGIITESYTGILAIQQGKWKLILDTKGSGGFPNYTPDTQPHAIMSPWRPDMSVVGQLYDLEKDPYETTDLYEQYPDFVNEMELQLKAMINNGRTR